MTDHNIGDTITSESNETEGMEMTYSIQMFIEQEARNKAICEHRFSGKLLIAAWVAAIALYVII